MRAEWKLTTHFMRRHVRQQVSAVLTITLFATAILLMLFMTQCFKASNAQLAYNYYGNYSGQTLFADLSKVEMARQTLQNEGAGIVVTQAQVLTGDNSNTVYIGYMDTNARKLRAVRLKEGTFPHSSSEIALDQTAYYRLRLTAKIGKNIRLYINKNGKTTAESYTLTGILYDYCDHWSAIAENMLNYKDPKLPSVLLGQKPDNSIAVHVMYPLNTNSMKLGGQYIFNAESLDFKDYVGALNRMTASATMVIGAFFLILALFGISVLARVTLQDRERFIKALQCIGLTRVQRRKLFIMQAGILAFISWVISVPLSLGILAAVISIAKLLGITLLWSISPLPVASTFVLIVGFTLLIFLLQQHKEFSTSKRKFRKKSLPAPSKTFNQAWTKLYRRSKFGKSTAVTLLNAGCIFALVFGVFFAELSGAINSYNRVKAQGNTDYYVYIIQGTLCAQELNAEFPMNMGMSGQELGKLRDNKSINVKSAYADSTTMPAFFRVKADETNNVLNNLKKRYAFENTLYEPDAGILSEIAKTRQLFGYKKSETLVTYPKIIAVDTGTMKSLLKEAGINGAQDWSAFQDGKTVYSLGGVFNKSDKFIITMPIIPKGSTTDKILGKTAAADFNVTVANTFTHPVSEATAMQFPFGSSKTPCVIISADAVIKKNPQLRFSAVVANNANPADTVSCAKASEAIHQACAVSKGMSTDDKKENIDNWRKIIQKLLCPVYALVLSFMIILMAAISILTRIKLKTNLHSYALLRSVGIEESRLKYKLTCDSLRSTGLGLIAGLIFSALIIAIFTNQFWYVPMTAVLLHIVLPVAVCGSVLILLFTGISTILSMKSLFKTSIVEALNTDIF